MFPIMSDATAYGYLAYSNLIGDLMLRETCCIEPEHFTLFWCHTLLFHVFMVVLERSQVHAGWEGDRMPAQLRLPCVGRGRLPFPSFLLFLSPLATFHNHTLRPPLTLRRPGARLGLRVYGRPCDATHSKTRPCPLQRYMVLVCPTMLVGDSSHCRQR